MSSSPTPRPDTLDSLLTHLLDARDALPSDDVRHQADVLLSNLGTAGRYGPVDRERLRVAVEAFCYVNDLKQVMVDSGVVQPYNYREPFPQKPGGPKPRRGTTSRTSAWTLLGQPIGFPIGVPASVLTSSSKWIEYFAAHGFNVFTYKTVRSRDWKEHSPPNWVFLQDQDEPLPIGAEAKNIVVHGDRDTYLRRLRSFSTANSFGVPSVKASEWQHDVERTLSNLGSGKLLIVSVMGSSRPGERADALRDDFVKVAKQAAKTGAPAIELNLSCPNTLDPAARDARVKPPLCMDVASTAEVVGAVKDAVGDRVKIVAKLSYMRREALEELVGALHEDVDAFSGINTLQVKVEDRLGRPTFGASRHLAGLSGVAIRRYGVDFVQSLAQMRDRNTAFDYEIIGMGGVMETIDVHALLASGADAVQTATAASTNPTFARELLDPDVDGGLDDERAAQRIHETLRTPEGEFKSPDQLAEALGLDPALVERELNPLGQVDLPRRVFELLSMQHLYGTPSLASSEEPDLEFDLWGPAPTEEDVARADETDRAVRAELDGLVQRSVVIEDVPDRVGLTPEALTEALSDGELTSFVYEDRIYVPAWQFDEDEPHTPLSGVADLRRAFGGDALALTEWVLHPSDELDGRTPLDALRAGDAELALAAVPTVGSPSV